MRDKKKLEMLPKVIPRIYDKNPDVQEVTEICVEQGASPEQAFFVLFFLCCCVYHNGYSRKNRNQSVEDIRNSFLKF